MGHTSMCRFTYGLCHVFWQLLVTLENDDVSTNSSLPMTNAGPWVSPPMRGMPFVIGASWYVFLCPANIMLAELYCILSYYIEMYSTVWNSIAWYFSLWYCVAWYCISLYGIRWYGVALQGIPGYCKSSYGYHIMVLDGILLYHMVLHWIGWYFTIIYGIALYLMVLQFIIWYCILMYLMVVFWLYHVLLYAIVWYCIISYGILYIW